MHGVALAWRPTARAVRARRRIRPPAPTPSGRLPPIPSRRAPRAAERAARRPPRRGRALAVSSVLSGFAEAAHARAWSRRSPPRSSTVQHARAHASPARCTCTRRSARCCSSRSRSPLVRLAAAGAALDPAGADRRRRAGRTARDLFHAFTRASWAVQSRDREGQLQETMTSQVVQATARRGAGDHADHRAVHASSYCWSPRSRSTRRRRRSSSHRWRSCCSGCCAR